MYHTFYHTYCLKLSIKQQKIINLPSEMINLLSELINIDICKKLTSILKPALLTIKFIFFISQAEDRLEIEGSGDFASTGTF